MTLEQDLRAEIVRLEGLVKYNRSLSQSYYQLGLYDWQHEFSVIAHVQETIVSRLQSLLVINRSDEYLINPQEGSMNAVKSLAKTGRDYCQFVVEVSGGEWGAPKNVALISDGGCGDTKRTVLTGFELPVDLPNGKYTMQAKVAVAPSKGGCGQASTPGVAHVQFLRPYSTPSSIKGNRDYGWAFEAKSPELVAALLG